MGYTFRPEEGRGGDAMEGKFCYGRTNALCDPAQGRGKYGLPVSRVRHFEEDRLQDLRALRAMWFGRSERSNAQAVPLCQSVARAGGSGNRRSQARETELGSPQ